MLIDTDPIPDAGLARAVSGISDENPRLGENFKYCAYGVCDSPEQFLYEYLADEDPKIAQVYCYHIYERV